jgi:uncharacterized membrane protein YdjX (TVP38/TMEM64 family)
LVDCVTTSDRSGWAGLLLLVGLMLGHAIVFYPSEIVTATAGYVYGFGPGLALVVGGWLVSALLCYALGRSVGRPVLRALLGQRFRALENGVEQGGTSLLLGSRLIPVVPFALVGYAAGATRLSLWKFSWTTVVGYLPLTIAVAYLGSRAQTLSLSNPLVWVAAAVPVGLLFGEWLLRHRAAGRDPGLAGPRRPTVARWSPRSSRRSRRTLEETRAADGEAPKLTREAALPAWAPAYESSPIFSTAGGETLSASRRGALSPSDRFGLASVEGAHRFDLPDADRRLPITEVVESHVKAVAQKIVKLLAGIPETDDPPATVHRPGKPEAVPRGRTSGHVPRLQQHLIQRGVSAWDFDHDQR